MSWDQLRIDDQLREAQFRWPFRKYQQLALDAFETRAPDHQHRCYLVMPPGSGKTALGLEIVRRAGLPAVVFCPNTAVQHQWASEWQNFQPNELEFTTDPSVNAPISFLTYQSLCNLNPEHEDLDDVVIDLWTQTLQRDRELSESAARAEIGALEQTDSQQYRRDLSRYRRRARRMIARGEEPERLLDLLHPNGKQLVEQIRALPGCTIVLDECHHLLEMWGYLVRALVDVLGEETLVVGLTATPPRDLNEREADLYVNLFGYADFEVPTPAVVKEGDLAPYQELAYITKPLPQEAEYIAEQHIRFEELITRLFDHRFAEQPFLEWIAQRTHDRFSASGARVSWVRFERDQPGLAQASLRLCYRLGTVPPAGVVLREPHRQPMTADDWVALIEDYAIYALRLSEHERDQEAWESIREALPTLGYVLTSRGIRRHVSPVDRVLSHSASKGLAAATILAAEASEIGEDLRALILCDYERTNSDLVAQLRGVLDQQAGSAILLLETLIRDHDVARLNPLLMTGQTVACSSETAESLRNWVHERQPDLAARIQWTAFSEMSNVDPRTAVHVGVSGGGWSPRTYVPMITSFFEHGGSQCLIGTRGLLGEGWDAQRVNTLIDLTTASTATSVHQMRGRSLRLDPAWPEKVANNWDVVCVDPEHPRGTSDYGRFVRKHRSYFAPNREGEIESGVSHVHHALSPFGPPESDEINAINGNLLRRSSERFQVRERWKIGEPYDNREINTVRVRAERSLGLPDRRLMGQPGKDQARPQVIKRAGISGALVGAATVGVGLSGLDPVALAAPVLMLGAGGYWTALAFHEAARKFGPSDHLEDFGLVVLKALRDTGDLPSHAGDDNLRVVPQEDGYMRCYVTGLTDAESQLFATSLDELLNPLVAPRYIIPRYVSQPPKRVSDSIRLGLRFLRKGRTGETVVYHQVPETLARNRERVDCFQRHWHSLISEGEALFHRNAEAQAVLQVQGGEDLFDVTTQMRTLWR
jgi:superfamily II DNA or RNA helicase